MRPDDMASLLSEYFTEMVECVFRHDGTLDKFIGDAVMAQWGAPIGERRRRRRALLAAIDMMRALKKLNAKWRTEGRPQLQNGIGVNYGEAFAGNIGSERRLEFTVIGDTVNTANRLCSAAEAGQILITEEIRSALDGAAAARPRVRRWSSRARASRFRSIASSFELDASRRPDVPALARTSPSFAAPRSAVVTLVARTFGCDAIRTGARVGTLYEYAARHHGIAIAVRSRHRLRRATSQRRAGRR